MDAKVNEWRPGPNVCRCCLTEGCYKDISTEYFWMGKREVYAEMLSETFDLTIAYSKSGGPNSNSRLICENCIARLRDATDFKRQVKECEKTFIQHLDPGNNVPADIELRLEPQDDKTVKLESVKLEKRHSDDDFDDRNDFATTLDDDDDDLDDEPLLKLASKTPKKETENVDILDLLDNAKVTEKRKSSTRSKEPPTKKLKKKEPLPKPSASKNLTTEKKKKGKNTEPITNEEDWKIDDTICTPLDTCVAKTEIDDTICTPLDTCVSKTEMDDTICTPLDTCVSKTEIDDTICTPLDTCVSKTEVGSVKRNLDIILEYTTACLFRWSRGKYICYFCSQSCVEPQHLRDHVLKQHTGVQQHIKIQDKEPVKVDFYNATCRICCYPIDNMNAMENHLSKQHELSLDYIKDIRMLPFKLKDKENVCQICGENCETFVSLNKHMNSHFQNYVCFDCGKYFATSRRLRSHRTIHEDKDFCCSKCKETFPSSTELYNHTTKVHRKNGRYKCPLCDEKFVSYSKRINHLHGVHNEKQVEFSCPSCPRTFRLCSLRNLHVKQMHLNVRNHLCNFCGSKFPTKYRLSQHMLKHGGEKKYQCDVCKKFYARMNTLREHMRIHNNDWRFKCNVCGQSFIQKCSLKQHLRRLHGESVKTELKC